MNRILAVFCAACLLGSVMFGPKDLFAASAAKNSGRVVVYNWSEYIPQDVLNDFTKETGIKVVYSTYESNEAMFAKVKMLRGRSYDVVCPSTYFVDLMVKDDLLLKLDHSKLPNLKNLDPRVLNQAYDPGNAHSVPYMWGTVGIMVNTKFIPKDAVTKWADLLKPEFKGRIILSDDTRDSMGAALKATGHSINSTDEKEIAEAYEFLRKLRDSVRVFDVTAIKQAFVSEEVYIGTSWNGDALVASEEYDGLEFVYPEEGAVVWVDNFAITSAAENVDNAYTFINYMLRPDIAKRCMEEFNYSTPNLETLKLLTPEQRANRTLNPTEDDLKNSEVINSLGSAQIIYEQYWEKLKSIR